MTDPGVADRTYVGPMTPELVEQILAKVGSDFACLAVFLANAHRLSVA